MESMQYGDTLVKEFLLYRGFSNTLRSFEAELAADASNGFQVDRVLELLFAVYIPKFEVEKLRSLMTSLKQSLLSRSETQFEGTLRKLESSLYRYYIVHAMQKGRNDKILEFFENYGDLMLQSGDDLGGWFAIPYMKNPSADARFHVYFTKEWLDTLMVSFRNFLCEVFDGIRLLRFHGDRLKFRSMKQEIDQLEKQCHQLQLDLAAKEASSLSRPSSATTHDQSDLVQLSSLLEIGKDVSDDPKGRSSGDVGSFSTPSSSSKSQHLPSTRSSAASRDMSSEDERLLYSRDELVTQNKLFIEEPAGYSLLNSPSDGIVRYHGGSLSEEENIPEVIAESQEIFSGHTSPITRCRFSVDGANVASASVDGTVRIWAPDKHASTARNATIYCGSEILSLEWEYKSDRLLLLGTSGGAIKVWNVDGKRVVCNLSNNASFPRVLDLKCSPADPIFVSAAASEGHQGEGMEAMGFGSLTVWNMRVWKPVNMLALGPDPPAIPSVCFNHNGKIAATGATDGMIRLFDMNGYQQITGWPVQDGYSVSCVKFGYNEASIWSLSSNGKIFEWSLHNQGQILQRVDASSFTSSKASELPRHEFALDSEGQSLLLTSTRNFAPIYSLGGNSKLQKTLKQTGAITSVDWHPVQSIFATGSADNSVQVTKLR